MTKIGIGRIGSGTIGNPTVPTTGASGPSRSVRATIKHGKSSAVDLDVVTGLASKAPLGTYVTDLYNNSVSVAGLGGGLSPLSFKLLARSNRSWPGPPMYIDLSGHSHSGFSASLTAWIGGSRISLPGGSNGFADSPSTTAQSPQQPRIEARFRLVYTGTTFIVGKYGTTAGNSSYKLELVNGAMVYTYSDGTTLHTATSQKLANFNFPEMTDVTIAVEHRNNGPSNHTNVSFYFSQDAGETWTQFGTTTAEATTIVVSPGGQNLKVGPGLGEIFWVKVYNATNQVQLAEFNAGDLPTGTTQWGSEFNVWSMNNSIGVTNPILVQTGDVPDWGLNYNTDVLVDNSPLQLDAAVGGSIAAAVTVAANPPAEVLLLNSTGANTGRMVLSVTATGTLRAVLGDNVFEMPSVVGDNVVLINFDSTEVMAYINNVPMPLLAAGRIPLIVNVVPSRSGDGSTNTAQLMLSGLAVLDRHLDSVERAFVTAVLQSDPLGDLTFVFPGDDLFPDDDLLPGG